MRGRVPVRRALHGRHRQAHDRLHQGRQHRGADTGHDHSDPAELFQLGQGEADGTVLRRQPGGAVQGGARRQSVQAVEHFYQTKDVQESSR